MISKYAVLKKGVIGNIVVADGNYFLDDFEIVKHSDETFCQPDMLYNRENGLPYDDK